MLRWMQVSSPPCRFFRPGSSLKKSSCPCQGKVCPKISILWNFCKFFNFFKNLLFRFVAIIAATSIVTSLTSGDNFCIAKKVRMFRLPHPYLCLKKSPSPVRRDCWEVDGPTGFIIIGWKWGLELLYPHVRNVQLFSPYLASGWLLRGIWKKELWRATNGLHLARVRINQVVFNSPWHGVIF